MDLGAALPSVRGPVPGPRSRDWVDRLARRECPAITARRARRADALGAADTDPIVWDRAVGANVQDVDGNVFVDLTAGFGVASVGHAHPAVVAAGQRQLGRLPHAMGDAFPDPQRIDLLERLAELTGLDRAILGSSGADAVEAALKTAQRATGRDAVLAFHGGYHGLSYGALSVLGYKREAFQGPFAGQMSGHVRFSDFGGPLPDLSDVGAVIVEPIQGRGGVRVPPSGWLEGLVDAAHSAGAVVIFDEIYTGFRRTGPWLRYQTEGVRPDLVCVGKGMAAGFPISACVGTAAVMDAWGASTGEALHTQTFLGNPTGCAMALACIEVLAGVTDPAETGEWLAAELAARGFRSRGAGLLRGVVVPEPLRVCRALLDRGFIVLPSGMGDEMVLCLTPPLTITRAQLEAFMHALVAVVAELVAGGPPGGVGGGAPGGAGPERTAEDQP
jgi:4-aminobutyrate aminotransferase / (S)-3-amino-2-methylpropionate transaminase / 5-aminovalerate transaminase